MLDDFDLDFDTHESSGLRRMLASIGRTIWWVIWDIGCEWMGWNVGWFACRVLSVGRFPAVGRDEEEHASGWVQLLVIAAGWAVLAALAWLALALLRP